MSLMAFVCDMGYRNGNSVHLWRKVMFPSQQSDMQISQRQTVRKLTAEDPCNDVERHLHNLTLASDFEQDPKQIKGLPFLDGSI